MSRNIAKREYVNLNGEKTLMVRIHFAEYPTDGDYRSEILRKYGLRYVSANVPEPMHNESGKAINCFACKYTDEAWSYVIKELKSVDLDPKFKMPRVKRTEPKLSNDTPKATKKDELLKELSKYSERDLALAIKFLSIEK